MRRADLIKRLSTQILARVSQLPKTFEPFSLDSPASSVSAEFIRRFLVLSKAAQKVGYNLSVVCFLDEIERIFPFAHDPKDKVLEFNSFFGALRSLSQTEQQLSLLVADVHPDCNRVSSWPQQGVASNPVFAFFKEIFLEPFTEDETRMMLCDIGQLMNRAFDDTTLRSIHEQSGGHPFLARQLASLVCRMNASTKSPITWQWAEQYVNQPFLFPGVLKDYIAQSVWEDLQKRDCKAALDILKIMASSITPEGTLTGRALHHRLAEESSESDWTDAVLWLESIGLITRVGIGDDLSYSLRVPLLATWVRMNLKKDDLARWRTP